MMKSKFIERLFLSSDRRMGLGQLNDSKVINVWINRAINYL